jgi:hypothetical protein
VVAAPPVQTTVVAVSPSHQHRPFTDGRVWLGDRVRVTIKDQSLPASIVLTGRVCFSVPAFQSTHCERFQFGQKVMKTITFRVSYNAAAIISWYQRAQLLAKRKLRITGGD